MAVFTFVAFLVINSVIGLAKILLTLLHGIDGLFADKRYCVTLVSRKVARIISQIYSLLLASCYVKLLDACAHQRMCINIFSSHSPVECTKPSSLSTCCSLGSCAFLFVGVGDAIKDKGNGKGINILR